MGERGPEHGSDHVLVRLRHQRKQVPGEVDAAALMPDALEHPTQRRDQAGMLVGDDQPDTVQTALLQGPEEPAPEHFVFGVADVQAEDLPAAVGGDRGRDDDSHRGDLPATRAGAADVQVGCVEKHVWERGVVQRPVPKRGDLVVQAGADPGDLRLRDAGSDAQGSDQIVDRTSRNPVHPGLHHHRIQGLVDPAAAFEDDGEERALPQLRDPQFDITGLGRDQPRPGPVALGRAGLAAFVAASADEG